MDGWMDGWMENVTTDMMLMMMLMRLKFEDHGFNDSDDEDGDRG